MSRKPPRWRRIKTDIMIFGPLLVMGLLILMLGEIRTNNRTQPDAGLSVSPEVAEKKATKIIARLVDNKQLDESWKFIKARSAKKIISREHREWKVIFINTTISDVTKQKIYVFLTLSGDHLAVNYSGN